ncbi:MAG: amino acid carrier protein [Muribaculaceae bacterium]|nr:amino acid carrier protein [Muribaculaceae bacterium]
METFSHYLTAVADFVCGYPLFFILIGGGLYLFISSGAVSIRRLPHALRQLRERPAADGSAGQISSLQALCSVVAATIGMGNIAGVAIALVVGGPGAIFWMWVSALVGMCTKYHEGVLAIAYRRTLPDGSTRGGSMYIIENALGPRWRWLAITFAVAGMFGTLCIMNANQLAEATVTITAPAAAGTWFSSAAAAAHLSDAAFIRLLVGITLAFITALVVLGGIRRIARVASVMVPFMVGIYFIAVLYILIDRYDRIPAAIQSIFTEAFNLRAGFGALIGTALIGARRAALVNDAGIGTATIMHSESRGTSPVREGLVAMLGPGIDSGFVCTLTALAILVAGDFTNVDGVKGLEVAMHAFGNAIPGGEYILMLIVVCFGLSSLFSYSFYGNRCATYLFGERRARLHTWFFILTLILFAVVPLQAAVGLCDLLYAFMAIPTMFTVLLLSRKVRALTRAHFNK